MADDNVTVTVVTVNQSYCTEITERTFYSPSTQASSLSISAVSRMIISLFHQNGQKLKAPVIFVQ